MNDSFFAMLPNSWKHRAELSDKDALDTVTSYVQDTEHDILSVITALQAHLDLLCDEQVLHHLPIDRFTVFNSAIARLTADTTALASVSSLARTSRSKRKQLLIGLLQEVASDTRSEFSESQVSLSCDIATGTTLIGNAGPLKIMIKGLVLALLRKCHVLDTVRIVGSTYKKRVSLSFNSGINVGEGVFKPWQLGQLRLIPMNGDGISLSEIDAIARLHHGYLSMSTLADNQHGYKLSFSV